MASLWAAWGGFSHGMCMVGLTWDLRTVCCQVWECYISDPVRAKSASRMQASGHIHKPNQQVYPVWTPPHQVNAPHVMTADLGTLS
jgi:hypothetical protein